MPAPEIANDHGEIQDHNKLSYSHQDLHGSIITAHATGHYEGHIFQLCEAHYLNTCNMVEYTFCNKKNKLTFSNTQNLIPSAYVKQQFGTCIQLWLHLLLCTFKVYKVSQAHLQAIRTVFRPTAISVHILLFTQHIFAFIYTC